MEEELIEDAWRVKNPEAREFTHRISKLMSIHTRLDYILVSIDLLTNIKVAEIAPTYMSDHDIPFIILAPTSDNKNQKGRGIWRLNVTLLDDPEYIEGLKEIITEVKKEKMTDIEKWEWLKYRVRNIFQRVLKSEEQRQNE